MSGHLDVLDPRFPVRWTLKAKIFDDLADEWDGRKTVRTVITNGARRDTITEVTYTQALTTETQPFRIITDEAPRTIYPELYREALRQEALDKVDAMGGDAA